MFTTYDGLDVDVLAPRLGWEMPTPPTPAARPYALWMGPRRGWRLLWMNPSNYPLRGTIAWPFEESRTRVGALDLQALGFEVGAVS